MSIAGSSGGLEVTEGGTRVASQAGLALPRRLPGQTGLPTALDPGE